MKTNGRRYWC